MAYRVRFGQKPNRLSIIFKTYNVVISWNGAKYTMSKIMFIRKIGELCCLLIQSTYDAREYEEEMYWSNFITGFLAHLDKD